MTIIENTFAAACYDMNSINDMEAMLASGPDAGDLKTWNLSNSEWKSQIQLAIAALRADEMDDGE